MSHLRPLAALALAFVPLAAHAETTTISQSGYLLNGSDEPVSTAQLLTFRLLDAGDTERWSGACTVTPKAGYFAVMLGDGTCGSPIDAADALAATQLEIAVSGTTLAPRHQLAKGAPAWFAANAGKLENKALSDLDARYARFGATVAQPGSLHLAGSITLTGPGSAFNGDGSGLSNLSPAALTGPGTIPLGAFPPAIARTDQPLTVSGSISLAGTGSKFIGDGSGLTNLQGSAIQPATAAIATIDCAGKDGRIYFDSTAAALFTCTGGTAKVISLQPTMGATQGTPGTSCKAILDAGMSTGDRTYWIDPNGNSPSDAVLVYCDMTNGGWTYGAILNTNTDTSTRTRIPGVTNFGTAAAPSPTTEYSANLTGITFTQVKIRNFTANDEYVKTSSSQLTWNATTYTSGGSQVAKRFAVDATWEFRTGYYVASSGSHVPMCFNLATVSVNWVCDADSTDILGMIDWSGGEGCNQGNWSTYGDLWQQSSGSCIDHRSSAAVYGFAVK